MSDDEYYGFSSPFDEYDEYWEEGAGDIAGDLAEHTVHSPVWQDDPQYGLDYYNSDWEYYSDDYWDEDPQLLKANPQDGGPPRRAFVGNKKGTKRKLAELEEIPPLDLGERSTLLKCVKGTVWAASTSEPPVYYREGDSEKIALLKDWKVNFRLEQGGDEQDDVAPRPGRLHRDESWANDMSLADMGLMGTTGRKLSHAEQAVEPDDYAEEESDGMDEDVFDREESFEPDDAPQLRGGEGEPANNGPRDSPRKRQRRAESNLLPISEQPSITEVVEEESQLDGSGLTDPMEETEISPQEPVWRRNKRPLDDDDGETGNERENAVSRPRKKRAAVSKRPKDAGVKEEMSLPQPTPRATRSRAKKES